MRWTPRIEVKPGDTWEVLPLDAFMGGLEIDRSTGEATLGSLTVHRDAAPANPDSWFLKPVRVSMVSSEGTSVLFEGQIRGSQLSPLQHVVTYDCATMTKDLIVNSAAIYGQLQAEVPWSTAIFGDRTKLTRREQFEQLLGASGYFVGSAGLVSLEALVKFHRALGEPLGEESHYKAFHTADDVVAKDAPASDVAEPFQVQFSQPKLRAPADGSGETVLPADVVAVPPVNRITCRVVHRFKRLVQEAFGYHYEGGHIITDHVEQGANWLTLEALESALSGTQMATVYKDVTHAPLYGNVSSGADPVYAGVSASVRGALVQAFDATVARRYIQECEYVYERDVRCDESIRRYGETVETREVTISDSTDWKGFTDRTIGKSFKGNGYMEVRDAADFAALGITSTGTREEALLALGALVGQATREIKVAHAASLTSEVGASTLITTAYSVLLRPDTAALDVGDDVAVQTSIWTVSGVVSGLVATMSPDGSARLAVTLTTNIAPEDSGEAPPVLPDAIAPLPLAVDFAGATLPRVTL